MTTLQTKMSAAGEYLLTRCDELADQVTERQYKMQPELEDRFGPAGYKKTRQDTLYNIRYLSQSIQIQSPLLFASYITWLKVLLEGYKITSDDLLVNLRCLQQVMAEQLEAQMMEVINPYIEQALQQIVGPLEPEESHLSRSGLRQEAENYTNLLLGGDRTGASQLIMDLVKRQVPIMDIYLHIFQQGQYEIGRLWQTNKISVAQEHYFTAATQSIMSQLYPYIFSNTPTGPRMVAACVGEELHEIGLRMLSDMFEMHGWDTYYTGANVPAKAIIDTLVERQADVLALSVTMTYHVTLAKELIATIREHEACKGVKILVGGLPFNIDRELWRSVGADGYAPDAKVAIETANELLVSK
ncbi:cobalamin-dependent protein [Paenibacillus daejeonensis]|uniref:cobalamin-dependent protein n=1 Tax=Paenibacillus daejeonensis TaxID=135193 RepID=UPI0003602CB0|nr:cobalamin-dependent protein [Paenibacillus daejeonensis]